MLAMSVIRILNVSRPPVPSKADYARPRKFGAGRRRFSPGCRE